MVAPYKLPPRAVWTFSQWIDAQETHGQTRFLSLLQSLTSTCSRAQGSLFENVALVRMELLCRTGDELVAMLFDGVVEEGGLSRAGVAHEKDEFGFGGWLKQKRLRL